MFIRILLFLSVSFWPAIGLAQDEDLKPDLIIHLREEALAVPAIAQAAQNAPNGFAHYLSVKADLIFEMSTITTPDRDVLKALPGRMDQYAFTQYLPLLSDEDIVELAMKDQAHRRYTATIDPAFCAKSPRLTNLDLTDPRRKAYQHAQAVFLIQMFQLPGNPAYAAYRTQNFSPEMAQAGLETVQARLGAIHGSETQLLGRSDLSFQEFGRYCVLADALLAEIPNYAFAKYNTGVTDAEIATYFPQLSAPLKFDERMFLTNFWNAGLLVAAYAHFYSAD